MAPDGVLQKVVASLRSVGEFDLAAISLTPTSSVYKAVERKLRRTLVIKLMPLSQWSNRAQVSAMAGAERRIVKGFDFPNIPRLLTGGEVDDHLFWITEFVDGIALNKTLEMGETLSALDLVDMARQLCNSAESTGKSGIVHHRFHPHNLIIEWDGGAKILDWGVPPYADLGPSASATSLHAAHYLAPEQLAGSIGDLRSNLFSIAAILYHLATAQLPFTGDSVTDLKSAMERGTPAAASKLNRKIPEGISAPLLKGLAANPEERYQSASEFLRDLENFKKYGVKEDLPENFYTRPASRGGAETSPSESPHSQLDSGLDFENAWTPAVTARQTADVAVMSLQDATVAVAERPPEPVPVAIEPPAPVKETVYCEPESKPAAPSKPKINLPKIKPPKVTMKDVNRVANKIPPLTAALVVAGVVVVLMAWKFMIPMFITKDAPVTKLATDTTQTQSAQPEAPAVQPAAQPAAETIANEAPSDDDVVVRTYDKSGRAKAVRKPKIKTLVLPPSPTTGELAVNTDPEGTPFLLDGRSDPSFITPVTVAQLAPGHHVVTFNKPGYRSQSLATDVTAGSRATIMTRLAVQGGTLSIGSTPAGARISIDGRDSGKTTPAQFIVAQGQHTVTLRFPGYLDASIPVSMADGQSHSVSPDLIPMGRTVDIKTAKKGFLGIGRGADKDMGRVTIHTEPSGATVLVNGQAAPRQTPTEIMLNPGGYELTFQLPGYQSRKKVIVVDSGSRMTVSETLQTGQ